MFVYVPYVQAASARVKAGTH